jgi:hypothetical protein
MLCTAQLRAAEVHIIAVARPERRLSRSTRPLYACCARTCTSDSSTGELCIARRAPPCAHRVLNAGNDF